jgi:ubiquinone/menaquinone biosynthesis C-methylase UbiE
LSANKSEKEMAFLQELYVATDWGERFAELINQHVELPKKGRILYVAAGTGGHAMALLERVGDDVTLACVDESEECLDLARAKAAVISAEPEFYRMQLESLQFEDEQFDLVVGDASLVQPERLPEMISEMVRVAKSAGTVALVLVTSSSFGEFFSIYWEALRDSNLEERGRDVEELIRELPTIAEIEALAQREGMESVTTWTNIEEFNYESGEEFLNAPLITDFLLKNWLASLSGEDRERVVKELERIIDEERNDLDFTLTIKATLIVGRK